MFNEKNFNSSINHLEKLEEKIGEEKIVEMIQESGFKELIEKLSKDYDLDSYEKKSDIPIPVEKITESNLVISEISSKVAEIIDIFQEMINEEETAKEYPFLLSGKSLLNDNGDKSISIDNFEKLYNSDLELENNVVSLNGQVLGNFIRNTVNNGNDVFILCHTHPIVSEENKKLSLTEKINFETKKELGIKEVGLNFSIQDLYQLYEFKKNLEEQKEMFNLPENCLIALGVLMFNGEMHIINIEDDVFKKKEIDYKEFLDK